jgi:hypothetical protein
MITLGEVLKVALLGVFVLIVLKRESKRSKIKEIHNFLNLKK